MEEGRFCARKWDRATTAAPELHYSSRASAAPRVLTAVGGDRAIGCSGALTSAAHQPPAAAGCFTSTPASVSPPATVCQDFIECGRMPCGRMLLFLGFALNTQLRAVAGSIEHCPFCVAFSGRCGSSVLSTMQCRATAARRAAQPAVSHARLCSCQGRQPKCWS